MQKQELPVPTDIKLKGRNVMVKIKVEREGKVETIEQTARFHVWGFRKGRSPDPKLASMEPVGVVELPDGKIRMVLTEKVQFLDQGY